MPALRALYWLCQRSFTDPLFPKYPRLPMIACPGFEPHTEEGSREEGSKKGEP